MTPRLCGSGGPRRVQDLLTFEGCKMGVIDPQDELRGGHQAVWPSGMPAAWRRWRGRGDD